MPPPPPPPRKFRSSQIAQSGTRLSTILILRFFFFLCVCVCVGGGGGGILRPPPLYEILVTPPFFPNLFCTLVGLPEHNILGVHVHMGC